METKEIKKALSQATTYENALLWVKNHQEKYVDVENYIINQKKFIWNEVCSIFVSIYFGVQPLLQILFFETHPIIFALLGVLWVIPLILIILNIFFTKKTKMNMEYMFLAIQSYRLLYNNTDINIDEKEVKEYEKTTFDNATNNDGTYES